MAEAKIEPGTQELVDTELRKGASNSRIANLLDLPYKEAVEIIDAIKEKIRPDVGEDIAFTFRGEHMEGTIEKLSKSFPAIVIYGPRQCGKSTVVNHVFKERIQSVTLDDPDDPSEMHP